VSKAALEMLALTYAAECVTSNVKVNLLNPGPMRTAMRAKAMPGEDPDSLPSPDEIAPQVVEMLSPSFTRSEAIVDFKK
jgi:NAD(P)-dependent dehydrogenase (short-subunit alcohol dehydrogenase family)